MSTTTDFTKSIRAARPSTTATLDTFNSKAGFAILMLWAFAMLSAGAFAHFGAHSYALSTFEILAPH
jgi:hypothetical protein